eukprot:2192212-Prymnesium_polylepis.2
MAIHVALSTRDDQTPTTVRKRRTGMLPRSRPGSRRIAVWQRSAGRTAQTLPRTHRDDTQGPSCPTTTTPGPNMATWSLVGPSKQCSNRAPKVLFLCALRRPHAL